MVAERGAEITAWEVISGPRPWPDRYTTTEYIITTENYGRTAEVRREFFRGRYPTATGVIVKGLLREGALIEISALAVLPR